MIRFRIASSLPVTGFGSFLARNLTLAPHLALAFTLWANRETLLDPQTTGAFLALALGGVALGSAATFAVLKASHRLRRSAARDGGAAAGGRGLSRTFVLTMTALVWVLLVLLPATPLIAVVPMHVALGGAGGWAASVMFTTANPRNVGRTLDPRTAGHWGMAPTYEINRHGHSFATGAEDEPDGTWPRGSLLASGLLLAVASLGLFGLLYPMWVPSAGLAAFAFENGRPIAIGSAVLGAGLGAAAGGYRTHSLTRWLAQKAGAAAVFAIALALLGTPLVRVALPYAASHATPLQPMRQEVAVTRIGDRHPRQGCRYSALVALGIGTAQSAWICEVPPDLWDGLRPGDHLILAGPGNALGIRYDRITRAD